LVLFPTPPVLLGSCLRLASPLRGCDCWCTKDIRARMFKPLNPLPWHCLLRFPFLRCPQFALSTNTLPLIVHVSCCTCAHAHNKLTCKHLCCERDFESRASASMNLNCLIILDLPFVRHMPTVPGATLRSASYQTSLAELARKMHLKSTALGAGD
jgi:hypothetical protein